MALADAVISEGATREELYELARTAVVDPTPAMDAAAVVRDRTFGPRITSSRKVFIPLTKLCRDNCGYCTFAHGPRSGERAYLTPGEVLDIARAGAEAGCKEALFTLGDKPEKRYPEARRELAELGFASTVEYLVHLCRLVLEETGLMPHANPGVLGEEEVRALRRVAVSQGIMLEQASDRLLGPNLAHWASPDKVPSAWRAMGGLSKSGGSSATGGYFSRSSMSPSCVSTGRGARGRVMDALMSWLRDNAPTDAYVQLIAEVGAVRFYEIYDFRVRTPEGSGMSFMTL